MKKILFAVPLLFSALLFTYCNKSGIQEETTDSVTEVPSTARASCNVAVYSDNVQAITLCGTQTNFQTCTLCGTGKTVSGVEVVVGNGQIVTLQSPLSFSISTASAGGSWINLVTSAGQTGFVYIPPGGCHLYTLNDDCSIN